jgi:hypothetical protein
MALGQIGFLTNVMEGLATVVGAGMLLGGFGAGVFGLFARQPRQFLEARVLAYGYFGGILGVVLALLDLITRYGN